MKLWPNKLRKARDILDRLHETFRPAFGRAAVDPSGNYHLQIGYDVRAHLPGQSVNMEKPVPAQGTAIWKINSW